MKRKQKGFTLVEVVISLSILVILISMLGTVFKATQDSFRKASSLQNVIDTSREIIQRMKFELGTAFFDMTGKTNLLGVDSAGATIKSGAGDEIFFYMPIAGLTDAEICEVGYWLRNDGNIMRHYDANPDFDFSTVEADDELGVVVDQLNFTYFNGTDYQDEWDSTPGGAEANTTPKSVQISFQVTDTDQLLTKTFETIVFIPSGKR